MYSVLVGVASALKLGVVLLFTGMIFSLYTKISSQKVSVK